MVVGTLATCLPGRRAELHVDVDGGAPNSRNLEASAIHSHHASCLSTTLMTLVSFPSRNLEGKLESGACHTQYLGNLRMNAMSRCPCAKRSAAKPSSSMLLGTCLHTFINLRSAVEGSVMDPKHGFNIVKFLLRRIILHNGLTQERQHESAAGCLTKFIPIQVVIRVSRITVPGAKTGRATARHLRGVA
ncbi:hypothetical protein VTK56DRAFT_671 [Thermocarpiscus australiensis]